MYLEESGEILDPSHHHCLDPSHSCLDPSHPCSDHYSESPSLPRGPKSVSVQFSPTEFLSATTRLAHLDLEGFERFVGSTFDRAVAGARPHRAQSSDLLDASSPEASERLETSDLSDPSSLEPNHGRERECERDTDTYVWRDSCR